MAVWTAFQAIPFWLTKGRFRCSCMNDVCVFNSSRSDQIVYPFTRRDPRKLWKEDKMSLQNTQNEAEALLSNFLCPDGTRFIVQVFANMNCTIIFFKKCPSKSSHKKIVPSIVLYSYEIVIFSDLDIFFISGCVYRTDIFSIVQRYELLQIIGRGGYGRILIVKRKVSMIALFLQ